jgi:hypothetical protein
MISDKKVAKVAKNIIVKFVIINVAKNKIILNI